MLAVGAYIPPPMYPISLQDRLFDLILQRFPRKSDAIEALCQLLNSSKDPVYRRLRGETFLTSPELELLARHYQISLDSLVFEKSDALVCRFNAFSNPVKSFEDYLGAFVADLEQLRRLPQVHLYYASAEIPVMTYHFLPELIGFKLYVWGRTTWNLDYLRNRPFEFDLFTPPVQRLSQAVLDHYVHLPGTELWSLNIVDNTLAQIEYHLYAGGFGQPSDALLLCDKLLEWAAHLKKMAEAGRKFVYPGQASDASAPLQVYQNEIVYTNNTALITSSAGQAVYSAFSNPNFIKSTDAKLCTYMGEWFASVIAKSNLISQSNEKQRDWFFQGLTKKIERVQARLARFAEEG